MVVGMPGKRPVWLKIFIIFNRYGIDDHFFRNGVFPAPASFFMAKIPSPLEVPMKIVSFLMTQPETALEGNPSVWVRWVMRVLLAVSSILDIPELVLAQRVLLFSTSSFFYLFVDQSVFFINLLYNTLIIENNDPIEVGSPHVKVVP